MKTLIAAVALATLVASPTFAQRYPGPKMRNNPTPQPSNMATVGYGAGMNPMNSQDLSGRSNPQDLTRSGASNPESLTGR
jgi:hypothetical protein